jgi:2-(1,2-epoxy-1,2-dihydrophenyl)acetyl-CoA isomerase
MTEPTVLFEQRGAVAIAHAQPPPALNSFTRQMHRDLWAAMDRAEASPGHPRLVITGAGRGFCAGADLAEFDFAPGPDLVQRADPGPVIDQAFNPTVRGAAGAARAGRSRPSTAWLPVLALSLAMTCDIAIAAPGASFIQAFSKIGLIPDAGGSWFLVERLGLARAMALAMTGDKLPAAQAKEWGLIWDVADDPLAAALALAERLAVMPTRPWWPPARCCATRPRAP